MTTWFGCEGVCGRIMQRKAQRAKCTAVSPRPRKGHDSAGVRSDAAEKVGIARLQDCPSLAACSCHLEITPSAVDYSCGPCGAATANSHHIHPRNLPTVSQRVARRPQAAGPSSGRNIGARGRPPALAMPRSVCPQAMQTRRWT